MSLRIWKKLTESIVSKNPWWIYKIDEFELPNGTIGKYHYVFTHGASMIIPVMDDGKIMMVNQYRYLCEKESLEFPCGGVKEANAYDKTAIQELAEETGYSARDWMVAGEFNPYNGVTNEICRVYIAKNMHLVDQLPDETEEFERVILNPDEIDDRIAKGVIWDGMTIAGWTIAKKLL